MALGCIDIRAVGYGRRAKAQNRFEKIVLGDIIIVFTTTEIHAIISSCDRGRMMGFMSNEKGESYATPFDG